MTVNVTGGTLSKHEIDVYTTQIINANPDKYIKHFDFTVDGEYVDVKYDYESVPFERIRRITGYLVGTVDRFNSEARCRLYRMLLYRRNCIIFLYQHTISTLQYTIC